MRVQNPNISKPYDHVSKDRFGTDLFGYRNVDGQEEIVNLQTGESNMQYHTPEMVLNPEGCEHVFKVINMGKRELECSNPHCRLMTSFHPAVNFKEENGKAFVILNRHEYEILSS